MANPHWVKGQSGNPAGKPKGAKRKTTIEKEKRRLIFDAEVSQLFEDAIKKAKPEYLLDQFIGKAPDKVEMKVEGEIKADPKIKELTEKLNELYKK